MEQNTRKSDFFCMISTTLTKTGMQARAALFYSNTLQVGF